MRDLTTRPSARAANIVVLDSGAGLANATFQQRLTAVRLHYDYLIEEGVRPDNPVGRGRYTPGKGFGGQRDRGLLPRYRKLPWTPSEAEWRAVLLATRPASSSTRVMLALAYDAALRREDLCSLVVEDIAPADRLVRLRAETAKSHQERVDGELTPCEREALAALATRRGRSGHWPDWTREALTRLRAPILDVRGRPGSAPRSVGRPTSCWLGRGTRGRSSKWATSTRSDDRACS